MKFALLCFLPFAFACHDLTPKQQARLDKFECQARALAPVVEPVYDAVELLRDLRAGKASLGQVLRNLAADEPEIRAMLERFDACEDAPAAPAAPDAG